jgi:hypothetical protein
MPVVRWKELTFTPDHAAIDQLVTSWGWRLDGSICPLLFTALGDLFFEDTSGEVYWLNTGTAELTKVAYSQQEFKDALESELAEVWFMPGLIGRLRQAGKRLRRGQCYTYRVLPAFGEGLYTVENLYPIDAKEHFSFTGHVHQQRLLMPGAEPADESMA